ncbi:MAG: porin family protein [Bacteroidales bacterium]|nr:porin family protein [Bacteroidales bacterium]MDD4640903.1 porin family protein [Bacteroidales bacterium]
MKSIRLICCLGLLLPLLSHNLAAQNKNFSPELYLGATAGATMSSISLVPQYVDKTYLFAANTGLSLRYINEKHFGIQAELNYFQSGWKDDFGYGSTNTYRREMAFLELPFLMHARIGSKALSFYLNLGPKFSFFLSEKEYLDSDQIYDYHGKALEQPFQWGVLGGVGFNIKLKRQSIGLEARYYYGLSDIFSNAVTDDFVTSSLQQISLNLMYYFRLR